MRSQTWTRAFAGRRYVCEHDPKSRTTTILLVVQGRPRPEWPKILDTVPDGQVWRSRALRRIEAWRP